MSQRRAFSCLNNCLRKDVVAPFKSPFKGSVVSVDRNIPVNRRPKAWERDELDKETWFKKKYAHVHLRSKSNTDSRRGSFDRDDSRSNSDSYPRRQRYERDPLRSLQPSPLHDYVYGVAPVMAALQAQKRGAFTELLFHNPKERHDEIMAAAKELEVPCKKSTKMVLNQLTNNNVHNGYVLKTKPLLPTEIFKLGSVDLESGIYNLVRNDFGQELSEEYEVARNTEGSKNPFGIYLDEISDPHNVGLIIRSAYYLGADFVVMSEKNCSKLTPAVSKASSGSMEFLPIYSTNKTVRFFEESQQNGWKFISSVAPSMNGNGKNKSSSKAIDPEDLKSYLDEHPCILVFGSEGTGVRTNLLTRSDALVSLESNRKDLHLSIDSLNVSVAAGLLLQKFLL